VPARREPSAPTTGIPARSTLRASICSGVDADSFRMIATRATHSHAVVAQLATIGAALDQLVRFDPVQLNADLHRDGS
jgi:hypothetical protein